MSHDVLGKIAVELVKTRIPGTRKGSEEPAYEHSLRIYKALQSYGYDEEVCLAGLLHDIVEDSTVTFEELEQLGFSDRVIQLVRWCSHDETIEDGDARWVMMMANLVEAKDADAWAIKVADVTDNLQSSHLLTADRARLMQQVKAPLILRLATPYLKTEPVWKALEKALLPYAQP